MKKQPEITLHMSEELLRKFLYIAEAEGRTPNNQFLLWLRNNIQYFERAKGKFDQKRLAAIDISDYMEKEED